MVVKFVNLRNVLILDNTLLPSDKRKGDQDLEQCLEKVIPFKILAVLFWQDALLKEIDGGRNHEIED